MFLSKIFSNTHLVIFGRLIFLFWEISTELKFLIRFYRLISKVMVFGNDSDEQ